MLSIDVPDIATPDVSTVLPRGQFLRNYYDYASACSDAPTTYHIGVGLTILAGATAKKLGCPWMAGRILLPNLYTLLVGPSRSSRKTGSMDAGLEILQAADPTLVVPIPGSYEELVAQVRKKPEGVLTYREFGHFLKTTQRGYGEPIRTMLMDLYDWPSTRPYVRNLKKGTTVIEAPIALSLLATIATDLLFSYADVEEWTGGFFGRMLLIYGERTEFRMPATWESAHWQLANILNRFTTWAVPPCGGFAPDAWAGFEEWSRWQDTKTANAPLRVQTFISGATTLVAKIALLYAADMLVPSMGAGWLIPYEAVHLAVQFVSRLYLPSVYHLGDRLTLSPWERDRQKVLDVISTRPLGVSRRDALRGAKISSEYLESVILTLKEEGSILEGRDARGTVYRRANPETAPVVEHASRVIPFRREGTDEES